MLLITIVVIMDVSQFLNIRYDDFSLDIDDVSLPIGSFIFGLPFEEDIEFGEQFMYCCIYEGRDDKCKKKDLLCSKTKGFCDLQNILHTGIVARPIYCPNSKLNWHYVTSDGNLMSPTGKVINFPNDINPGKIIKVLFGGFLVTSNDLWSNEEKCFIDYENLCFTLSDNRIVPFDKCYFARMSKKISTFYYEVEIVHSSGVPLFEFVDKP